MKSSIWSGIKLPT